MSIQAHIINGYGVEIKDKSILKRFKTKEDDDFYELLDLFKLDMSYYELRELSKINNLNNVKYMITYNKMDGNSFYIILVNSVVYLENTHGDEPWSVNFKYDDFEIKNAKRNLELIVGNTLPEFKHITFSIYS